MVRAALLLVGSVAGRADVQAQAARPPTGATLTQAPAAQHTPDLAPPASNAGSGVGALPTDADLLNENSGDWLLFNRTYGGDRYSPLAAINTSNARRLTPRCVLQLGEIGSFETSPIIFRGRIYVTTPHKTVAADAGSCAVHWSHSYTTVGPEHITSNRGAVLYRGRLYRGTTDGHLLALDADSGKLVWDIEVADPRSGYFVSAAPMVFDGKVFLGEGGADHGIKGHIHAFDADTGKEVWRFDVIPTGSQAGADTWSGGQETGGGSSWSSMAVDPRRHLLFVPTGNPGPDFNPATRRGTNLYTDSVVVLSSDTGALQWYVQQVPGDVHDWDTAAAPSLFDQEGRHYMAVASKDGFLYLYDRETHRLLSQTPTMTRVNVDTPFNPDAPVRYCPGGLGQWNGPAYSPRERLVYVGSADRCDTIQLSEPKYVRGQIFFGGLLKPGRNEQLTGTVRGVAPDTGRDAWVYHSDSVIVAGVTPTAGGLLLSGDGAGNFLVFEAKSGKILYRFSTGGGIAGGISTYSVAGEQLIAVPSGNSSKGIWNTAGSATVVVFGLDAG
jgi:alcohol dehydrogenase (cytochrome c)